MCLGRTRAHPKAQVCICCGVVGARGLLSRFARCSFAVFFHVFLVSRTCATHLPCQMRTLFAKFDEHRELWASAVRCLAHLDAVLSLAEVSAQPGFSRPQFYEGASTPSFVRFKNARHPCLAQTYQGGEYIPNDAALGAAPAGITDDTPGAPNMLLLTGPNMGGKSTLLRQTCLVAILAQVRSRAWAHNRVVPFLLCGVVVPAIPNASILTLCNAQRSWIRPHRWAASFLRTTRTSHRSTGFSQGLGHQTVSWLDSRLSSWSSVKRRISCTTPQAGAS